jgi:hypothetical protein
VNDTVTTDDGIKSWLTQLPNKIASPSASERCTTTDCRSPTTCTVAVKIENAPELLLIRATSRSVTPDDNDFFKIPFTKTINLSAYSAGGDSLVYDLHCNSATATGEPVISFLSSKLLMGNTLRSTTRALNTSPHLSGSSMRYSKTTCLKTIESCQTSSSTCDSATLQLLQLP